MSSRPPFVRTSLALACLVALSLPLPQLAFAQSGTSAASEGNVSFNLAAAPLARALNDTATAAGVSLSYDPALVAGRAAPALQGRYTVRAALARLLQGTDLVAREVSPGAWSIQRVASTDGDAVVIGTLRVGGERSADPTGIERDERGYDDVYDLDLSTVYAGREQIERYKGAAPADIFKGMVNVYSGDARNSGALDPNIRGIQGPGRVPLTIDGTEQALTVWRGYMGANNRNYIDPSLIGGMQVIKGPAMLRGANTSVGGAVQIKTLDVDDILLEGESFGGELKMEASDNAIDPKLPTLLTGKPIGSVPGFPASQVNFYDPTLYQHPRTSGSGSFGSDQAWRLALGLRKENFDLMAAYAFREKGNHFAGKHGSSFYDNEPTTSWDYVPYLAKVYVPGSEILNSSSRMESWLVKGTWRLSDTQVLQLNVRDTQSRYGEIMPSRIQWDNTVTDGIPQWPLSQVDARAVNLEYKWRPGLDWVDLRANLWRTDTDSATYSSGGLPNDRMNWYNDVDKVYVTPDHFRNTAVANSKNARTGFSFDNKMQLSDSLDLTVGGNLQKETLSSKDVYNDPEITGYWRGKPRAGWRREYDLSALFEWRPIDKLLLSAGVRYQNWQSFDEFLARQQRAGVLPTSSQEASGRVMKWNTLEHYTQAEIDTSVAQMTDIMESQWPIYEEFFGYTREQFVAELLTPALDEVRSRTTYTANNEMLWKHDGQGRYNRADNPCINGAIDFSNVELSGGRKCWSDGPYPGQSVNGELIPFATVDNTARRQRGAGWVPSFAATYEFSEHSRVYLRHSQVRRFPALFESTIGFSSVQDSYGLKPEHAFNTELSWVQDFGQLLDGNPLADLKIAYYHHRTRDVIERSPQLTFSNIDEQTIRGVEVQGRFDNGRFFTDISGAWNLENRVCDEHTAMLLDNTGGVSNCVETGFVGGYLVTMAIPRYTFNWTVGTRLFDGRLELGSRIVHHAPQESVFKDNYGTQSATISYYLNTPLQWGRITTYDAYATWRVNDRATVEVVGTNLGNLYYIDPLTRSSMLAPGRTLKASFNYRF